MWLLPFLPHGEVYRNTKVPTLPTCATSVSGGMAEWLRHHTAQLQPLNPSNSTPQHCPQPCRAMQRPSRHPTSHHRVPLSLPPSSLQLQQPPRGTREEAISKGDSQAVINMQSDRLPKQLYSAMGMPLRPVPSTSTTADQGMLGAVQSL